MECNSKAQTGMQRKETLCLTTSFCHLAPPLRGHRCAWLWKETYLPHPHRPVQPRTQPADTYDFLDSWIEPQTQTRQDCAPVLTLREKLRPWPWWGHPGLFMEKGANGAYSILLGCLHFKRDVTVWILWKDENTVAVHRRLMKIVYPTGIQKWDK